MNKFPGKISSALGALRASTNTAATDAANPKAKLKVEQLKELDCILDEPTKEKIKEIAKEEESNYIKIFGRLIRTINVQKSEEITTGVITEDIFKTISEEPFSFFYDNKSNFYEKLNSYIFNSGRIEKSTYSSMIEDEF